MPDTAAGHPVLTTLVIVVGVLVLAAVRAWTWVRKERVLRRVGLDLHVPAEGSDPGSGPGRTDGDSRHTGA